MFEGIGLISLAIWVPILAGVLILVTGGDKNADGQRTLALIGSVLGFLVAIPLWTGFDASTSAMQFGEVAEWLKATVC